ncbi:MAG: hypothetical protein U5P10_10625 [Spirochaetia bacterium]|nr:hypothetical protein [Spirochaetia bacterium]
MRTLSIGMVLLLCISAAGWAQTSAGELFEQADELYKAEQHQEAAEVLKKAEQLVSSNAEKAELYWRLSRTTLNLADEAERNGASADQLLEEFEKGEALANRALEYDDDNHHAYYWRGSNIGRWGQTKGVLNSLMKAGPMRDDIERAVRSDSAHADSFYVLGMLYASVPKLISFGNKEYAVSYSRRAIDAYRGDKTKYSYYLKLGDHLYQRDWNSRKRQKEARKMADDFSEASDPVERYKYFTAAFDPAKSQPYSRSGVKGMSDREEARAIMEWIVDELKGKYTLLPSEKDNLEEAQAFLSEWG